MLRYIKLIRSVMVNYRTRGPQSHDQNIEVRYRKLGSEIVDEKKTCKGVSPTEVRVCPYILRLVFVFFFGLFQISNQDHLYTRVCSVTFASFFHEPLSNHVVIATSHSRAYLES